MANRAYLFADHPAHIETLCKTGFANRVRYYDSRHNLPLGWMFLFTKNDLRSFAEESLGSKWIEWKLVAPKPYALQRFRDRIDQVKAWALPSFDLDREIHSLADTLERWEGSHLVLDPEEIFGGCGLEGAKQKEFLQDIFLLLDSPSPTRSRMDPRKVGPCWYSLEPKDFHQHCLEFLGTTYAWDEDP